MKLSNRSETGDIGTKYKYIRLSDHGELEHYLFSSRCMGTLFGVIQGYGEVMQLICMVRCGAVGYSFHVGQAQSPLRLFIVYLYIFSNNNYAI